MLPRIQQDKTEKIFIGFSDSSESKFNNYRVEGEKGSMPRASNVSLKSVRKRVKERKELKKIAEKILWDKN